MCIKHNLPIPRLKVKISKDNSLIYTRLYRAYTVSLGVFLLAYNFASKFPVSSRNAKSSLSPTAGEQQSLLPFTS